MILNYIIILIVTAILQLVAPWWVIALVPFLVHIWRPTNFGLSFLAGFLAIATLWLGYGWYLHNASNGLMSNRIAEIFTMPNTGYLLAITALVGGLAGGFAGMAGFSLKNLFIKDSYFK